MITRPLALLTSLILLGACGAPVPDEVTIVSREAPAQEDTTDSNPVAQRFSIERLYGSPALDGPAPRNLAFSPDGQRITFLRPKADDRNVFDLWAMDVADGRTYQLVDSRVLAPEERALSEAEIQQRERARITGSGIVRYDWDANGRAILVPLDGDVFYVDVETGQARRLMETDSFETDARVSPSGGYVSFIRDQNLWVHDLATGEERALTTEGGGLISWGMAEFVAQEEMDRSTGYWWSRDDRYVAVARIDESPVMVVERFDIGAEGVAVQDQRYPRAGTDNVLVELWVINVGTGQRRRVDLGSDPDIYLTRVNWNGASDTIYVQRMNRRQTQLDLLAVTAGDGRSQIVLSETADTWINLHDNFTALEDGGFLWTSERSGFRHIYRAAADGSLAQLTSGSFVVDEISGLAADGETVYFEGWVDSPLERHLYAVPVTGGTPRQITTGAGQWAVTLGDGGRGFIGRYSDPATPPHTALYTIDGQRIAWIEENALDADHPYAPYLATHIAPEFGTLTAADGATELHWMMYRPAQCTVDTPCPAIVQVYGGPHVQRVTRSWQALGDQVMAQRGYVLFKLDNRGSWNRGHAFEAALYHAMGSVEVQDQLAGLDFLQAQPFIDPDHVGIWGWSYGGYMALMTTLQAPDRFAAAIAGAPVTDWSLYDTYYTERYMGLPQENQEGYRLGSAFAHVQNYATPTLIIHGMADDNVTFDQSTRLFAALQEQGSQFEMMTYPGQRHGIRGPALQGHRLETMLSFFDRTLGSDAAP